jgi:hypothetical protein
MDHEHHGYGAQGGDHSPATGQLSPNEHRQHAEPDEHGWPAATRGTAGTGPMAGMGTTRPSSGTGSGGAWS